MNRILSKYALKIGFGLCASFLLIFLHACISKEVIDRRTILFYIGSDSNGLDNGGTGDEPRTMINAMRAGWIPHRGELLIYTDQTNRPPCLMRINGKRNATDGLYGLDTVHIYNEENSADAAVLNRVIHTVVSEYPADSYGMLFFSHASGWLPEGMLVAPRSLVIDKGEGIQREMEYNDFAAAIPDKQFDFMIFDACFITDVMMMYELRNKTEYVLAASAEIVSPGFTPVYKANIMRLYDTKSPVSSVVTGFAQSYVDYIKKTFPEDDVNCSVTLGVIKMNEIENLALSVKEALGGVKLNESTLTVDSIQRFDRPNKLIAIDYVRRNRYFDLGHIFENLVTDQLITDSTYAAFQTQMEKTVVWKANTKRFLLRNYSDGEPYFSEYDGFYIKHHSGLSTYIEQDIYPVLNEAYKNSSWYKVIY